MDSSISACQAEFRRVGLELQFATHRLESELADAVAAGRSKEAEQTKNTHPLSLMRRVRAATRRADALAARAQALEAAKAQTLPPLQHALAENEALVAELRTAARLPAPCADPGPGPGPADACEQGADENAPPAPVPAQEPAKQLSPTPPPAPVAVEASGPVEQDFEALPASVRGRCRFADVARTYEALQAMVAALPRGARAKPVTRQQMDARGIRVAGKTGDCILASLRAMGLLQTSKAGVRLL